MPAPVCDRCNCSLEPEKRHVIGQGDMLEPVASKYGNNFCENCFQLLWIDLENAGNVQPEPRKPCIYCQRIGPSSGTYDYARGKIIHDHCGCT